MKTITYQIKNLVMWSIFAMLITSLAVLTTACGKKDGKGGASTPPGYNPNCPNCVANGTLLGSALGFNGGLQSNYRMQLGITLSGNAGTTAGFLGYSGPVSAVGVMSVKVSSPYCPMPVGAYQVATTQQGQWDTMMGGFRGLIMEARHADGTVLKMRMLYGIVEDHQPNLIDDGGRVYPYGLVGDLVVDSVNQSPCVVGFPGLPPLNQFFFTY